MKRRLLRVALLLFATTRVHAREISTNGSGGGPWSDPATWHGKTVPGPEDEVIIQKFDVLAFDRNDDGKVSCRKLQIDPKGMFTFKTGAGKAICCIEEAIECYGIIKIDGTKSATDFFELRLVGDTAKKRQIKLERGAGLLLYGKADLPEGRCNVALTSPRLPDQKDDVIGLVEGEGKVSIDWHRAAIRDLKLIVKKIDNTGSRPNERLNVVGNQFSGQGRVSCQMCDTPVIAKNTFEFKGAKPLAEPAISVSECPLADIKGNTIRGGFNHGISVHKQSDAALVGNTVEKCAIGIVAGPGVPNMIIKQCVVRDCATGIKLEKASGVLEEITIEGAETALYQKDANLQLTSFQVKDLAPKGQAVLFDSGTLVLLNCNILPGQIKVAPQPAKAAPVPVTAMQYVVVSVKGAAHGKQAAASVELRSAGPAAPVDGADDANVHNSPAPLAGGLTPLPRTLGPLIVKTWSIDDKGKVQPIPEYRLTILGSAPKEGANKLEAAPVLHTMTFRPQESALRTTPADAAPTVEVTLK